MTNRFFSDSYFDKKEFLFYENVSRLVTRPNILSHLQDLKLDGGEKTVSFQWLGPHFLTLLKYAKELSVYYNREERFRSFHFATKLCLCFNYEKNRFLDLLKRLDDSASDCILYGGTEHYKNFLEIILSFMPQIREFFTIQKLEQSSDTGGDGNYTNFPANFIGFILETIGELQNCPTYSSVLVSNQVKVLQKELNFTLNFLVDEEQSKNMLEEIGGVFNEAGLFLHSFFFTTDLVTATKMDLEVFDLLERIEIMKVKMKYQCIAVSMEMNCGIKSLQAVESSSEVSSSQDKSIPMVEEMIVGFDDMTTQIVGKLLGGPNYRQIISITGMGGLGKTTLAKQIYNHSSVQDYFDKLSWCVVSQTYQKRKLLIDILRSISDLKEDEISEMKYEKLAEALHKTLFGRRYLIVMDDLWDIHAWNDLNRYFPQDSSNGSRVLITSREKNVASKISQVIIEPPPLSPGESWNLLEQKVFKKERCPQELQDIGKKIATNCHGLPLSVVLIAGVLSNMENKESLWQQVAKKLSSYISQKADDYIPSLELSYMHLPNHLKPCFLYLSAFQEDEKIPIRKLFSLWIAEGFIVRKEQKSFEDVAEEYLMELINRSLLQVSKRRSDNGVKACTLHDLVLDMCRKIAVEDETFLFQHQFLISKHFHRLCMDPSHNLSEALSILYNSDKIRIFESGFYNNFAKLGFKIMHDLRYLEIGFFISSIGRFRNLEEVLIINKYMNLLIPAFLLNMPKLRHLCAGSPNNPARFDKNCCNSRKNNLETLRYVYIDVSMDTIILSRSPNLRMLKFKSPKTYRPNLDFLTQLETLTMICKFDSLYSYPMIQFPSTIKKLTLVGINLKLENMSLIGKLPNLEIFKLNGDLDGIWNTKDDEFQKLKFLKLELRLILWNSSHDHFPVLERLVLESCKYLKMIPLEFSYIPTLLKIEVYNCGEDIKTSALKILEEKQNNGEEEFELTIP